MDRELVTKAQDGDRAAFAELAVAVGDRLHAVAHRMLRDPGLAEDASQQTLLTAWQKLPTLRDPDAFEGWCFRLLVNVCHKEWRDRQRTLGDPSTPLPRIEPTARDEIGPLHDADVLEQGFARLSMDHRVVVVLRYYLDMPVPRIAAALGVREGTAKSRLYHAMRGLRAALEADARAATGIADGREVA